MSRIALLLIAGLFFSNSVDGQDMALFLPAKVSAKAAKLLASIDDCSALIDSRRKTAREVQLKAEGDAVEAYALISASRSSGTSWAKPDGSARSADAAAAFAAARKRARTAALVLASGADGLDDSSALVASREAAEEALSAAIRASGIGLKAAIGLEKYLAGTSKDLARLFPELTVLVSLLQKAGAEGAREAAAAMAHRGAERVARSLIASKARLLSLSPVSAAALSRLEIADSAYRDWTASFPAAAYPGDLSVVPQEERSALAASVVSFSRLGTRRSSSLLEAMSEGGSRDSAAAEAARRLADLWARSPAVRRRDIASICGLSESELAVFAAAGSGLSIYPEATPSKPTLATPTQVTDPLAAIAALNGLEIAIADEEARSESPPISDGLPKNDAARGAEPALLFLEYPELAAFAQRETRYVSLYAEASRRLSALYAQAAESAQARLEASNAVAKAAALALGSSPAGILVYAIDLDLPPEEYGRRIAFFATATDASGLSLSFPLSAEVGGEMYASAFSKAAGFGSAKPDSAALLAKYGQLVVSAYDPEGSNSALTIEHYPKNGGPARLGDAELELALLGGWRP
jgi:hypothetical protein